MSFKKLFLRISLLSVNCFQNFKRVFPEMDFRVDGVNFSETKVQLSFK